MVFVFLFQELLDVEKMETSWDMQEVGDFQLS